MKIVKLVALMASAGMLSSCDLSQIPGLDKRLSIEDSKAIGAACRHSGRALEDCFTLNPMAHQAGVFEGWRDMNDYMMANKIEVVKPEIQVSNFSAEAGKVGHGGAAVAPGHVKGSETLPSDGQGSADSGVRPRWDPTKLGAPRADQQTQPDPHAQSSPSAQPDPHGQADAHAPPSQPTPPASSSRPWERKSPDKSAT